MSSNIEHFQKNSRHVKAEHTKLQIFEAAIRLLEIKEFDSITVRDIVKEANVSIGSFYNSYPSKLDVFYETYQISDNYFEKTVRPQLTEESAIERIRHFFREYATYNSSGNPFALTKVLYNSSNSCFHRHSDSGMVLVLRDCVQYGLSRGEFSTKRTAEEIENFLMVCIRGLVYDWCTCNGGYNLGEKMSMYVDALLLPLRRKASDAADDSTQNAS